MYARPLPKTPGQIIQWPMRPEIVRGDASILNQIGNTPLLRLTKLAADLPPDVRIFGKAEWFNPGGSVKDRPALRMIEEGERTGQLEPGKTIIDSTSGNTGIAYALIGAAKGYSVELVMPANVSVERKQLAQRYGARLILSDPLEGSDGAIREVRRRVAEEPDKYFYPDQYNNPANWQAHFFTTAPEIWRQTGGKVTHLVAGIGTSGTLMGAGRRLKQYNPNIQVIAVEPADELQVIEGLKYMPAAIVPGIYDAGFPDRFMAVDAEDAWNMTRRLAREEGWFVGISAGAAIHAALKLGHEVHNAHIAVILPDSGEKYLSLGVFDE